MFSRYLSLLCILCFKLVFIETAFASEKYVFAAEDSWPPFANQDGTGLSRDIIEKALAFSGTEAEFIVVPYARALRMAEKGLVDGVFNVTKQGSTIGKFVFGTEPLLQAKASYFYPKASQVSYKNPADIPNNTVIGLIIGYEYGNQYEKHRYRFKEVRVSHQNQLIQMLIENKIHMAIMFDKVFESTAKEMNMKPNVVKKGHINHTSDIYVAFSKKVKNLDYKIKLLDSGLRKLNK